MTVTSKALSAIQIHDSALFLLEMGTLLSKYLGLVIKSIILTGI
mgnify:CR=1 FL=1